MLKNRNDIFFGFCITFIIILAIYLVVQRTQQDNLEKYLQLLQDKIANMMPKEEKKEIDQFFSELIDGLENESVSPKTVEKLAENIIELRKKKAKLSKEDLHKLIPSFKTDSVDYNDLVRLTILSPVIGKSWPLILSNLLLCVITSEITGKKLRSGTIV